MEIIAASAVLGVHAQHALVVGAPESEGDEPGVQQARWYGSLMFSCISFQLPGMRWRL